MATIYVGIGEYAVSNTPGEVIKTLALGSCVAVILHAPEKRLVGMLHIALPESTINQNMAQKRPGMFADTGISKLLEEMKKHGWMAGNRLFVKLAGGASVMDPNHIFNIGKRNILAVRKILWMNRLGALAEDVGGSFSRSVSAAVDTGHIRLSSPGRGEWEL